LIDGEAGLAKTAGEASYGFGDLLG